MAAQSLGNKGFTIIEMMVVIAIIAILGAMIVPTLNERVVIKQIDEGLALAELAKRPIGMQWATTQTFPEDNAAVEAFLATGKDHSQKFPAADKIVGNFVTSVTVQGGAVHIRFGNNAASAIVGKTLSLRPAVVSDAPTVPVAWVCAKASVPDKMTVHGADRSDIPLSLLPRTCRAKSPAS